MIIDLRNSDDGPGTGAAPVVTQVRDILLREVTLSDGTLYRARLDGDGEVAHVARVIHGQERQLGQVERDRVLAALAAWSG